MTVTQDLSKPKASKIWSLSSILGCFTLMTKLFSGTSSIIVNCEPCGCQVKQCSFVFLLVPTENFGEVLNHYPEFAFKPISCKNWSICSFVMSFCCIQTDTCWKLVNISKPFNKKYSVFLPLDLAN